jgi:hypothetical protein
VTFCRFCGKPLPSGSKCPSCGWSENAVSQAAGRAEAAEKAAGIEVPAEDHPLYQFTDIEGNVSISDDKYDFVAREGELKRDGMLTDFKPPIYKFIDSDGKLWESNVKDPPLPYPGAVLTAAEEAADRADAGGIAAKDAASATSGAFGPAAARAAQAASSTGLSKTQLAVVIAVITLLAAGGGAVLMQGSNPLQWGGGGNNPALWGGGADGKFIMKSSGTITASSVGKYHYDIPVRVTGSKVSGTFSRTVPETATTNSYEQRASFEGVIEADKIIGTYTSSGTIYPGHGTQNYVHFDECRIDNITLVIDNNGHAASQSYRGESRWRNTAGTPGSSGSYSITVKLTADLTSLK